MLDYQEFMMRHGECGIQDLVERMERNNGIVANANVPLEERWEAVMLPPDDFFGGVCSKIAAIG